MDTRSQEILQMFSDLPSWEDRYKKIIELGKAASSFPEDKRVDDYKVQGCQSQVWLTADVNDRGLVEYQADSDALIAKGLVALMIKFYTNRKAQEIVDLDPDFVGEIGLMNHLSPNRANGLSAMIKQIKFYALALSLKN